LSARNSNVRSISSLSELSARDWNALVPNNDPFLRHEYLCALEQHNCVGSGTGWHPCHLTLVDEGRLVAAAPLYLKEHSFGEFVFDWAWANAYRRCGLEYYPKLVAAVPFTPVSGARMLVDPAAHAAPLREALLRGAIELAQQRRASSLHWLFTTDAETQLLCTQGLLPRLGTQFHWRNAGYSQFDDFLASLTSKKRKNVRHERRRVADAGITMTVQYGGDVPPSLWRQFHAYYALTSRRKGGTPYLSAAFFCAIGKSLPEQTLLVGAWHQGEFIAGALCLRSDDTLYGRHWGSHEAYDSLHFEACYYTPIEYCISKGIARFEAGAQGEHKLSRGFLPAATHSAHWIADSDFRNAIAQFVAEEAQHMTAYCHELEAHSPYRHDTKSDDNAL
jgi:predicted N-acyltransferase